MTYTRPGQVLTSCEVEYLFTVAHDELGKAENQIRSLASHFRETKPHIADKLESAVNNVMIARSKVHSTKREAVNHGMPHRDNAGELD